MPTWIASSSPDAIAWSASQGHAILMDPHSTHQEIAYKYRSYRDQLAEHGHNEVRDTPIARLLAIADTDEKAEAVARAGAQWTVGSYVNPKSGSSMTSGFSAEDRIDRYVNEIIIHGSPSTVTDKLKELEETMPLDYLMASILSHETFMRLSEEVMPNLR
jgi:alkanesulfonate monooxygenase SsuD/methylene tetrahydromethanopterin reductase-like flavin-dependent oxidoreductase (luciferase family)